MYRILSSMLKHKTWVSECLDSVSKMPNYLGRIFDIFLGHSWSPVFGRSYADGERNNGDILISTLGLVNAIVVPNLTSLPVDLFQPRAEDLNSIIIVDEKFVKGPRLTGGKKYVRVGTFTTSEQLRRWCIETGKVTLPMQIIEVEIIMGGSNTTI